MKLTRAHRQQLAAIKVYGWPECRWMTRWRDDTPVPQVRTLQALWRAGFLDRWERVTVEGEFTGLVRYTLTIEGHRQANKILYERGERASP